MKKLLSSLVVLTLVLSLCFTGCSKTKVDVDYGNATTFEAALNRGEDVSGKIVSFKVDELVPNSAFGYNMQAGEHLNFCSRKNPNVELGEIVTVKVTSVESVLGSYIISYKMM